MSQKSPGTRGRRNGGEWLSTAKPNGLVVLTGSCLSAPWSRNSSTSLS